MTEETQKNNLIIPFILIAIILLAIGIRIYYFYQTEDQTLWWDELSFGGLAKNMITHQWDNQRFIIGETNIRPLILPFLWSLLMRMNISEAFSKFILEIIPSILSVVLIYFVARQMYNKRIALISSFILAISWIAIFYSMRFMTHIPGLLFSLASIYCFFKSIETDKISFKYFAASIFLLFISALFRWNYGLVIIPYFFVLLVSTKLSFLKQKAFWLGGLVGSIPIIIFFAINLVKYGVLFPALSFVSEHAAASTKPFAFYTFGFLPHILQQPFFYIMILGFLAVILQLILGYDSIRLINKLKSHLFILILFIVNLAFLIFYIKYAEDRYLFECLLSIILFISLVLDFIYVFIKRYSKVIGVIIVLALLFWGAYSQFTYGNQMIISKSETYSQMKPAFLWLKENVPPNSIIIGSGIEPYTIYYSGLQPIEYYPYMNESILNGSLKVDYYIYHAFTPQDESYSAFLSNQTNFSLAYVAFFDEEQKQPAIYIIKGV